MTQFATDIREERYLKEEMEKKKVKKLYTIKLNPKIGNENVY